SSSRLTVSAAAPTSRSVRENTLSRSTTSWPFHSTSTSARRRMGGQDSVFLPPAGSCTTVSYMSYTRDHDRVQLEMFLNQSVAERLERGVTSNVSPTGLYLHRVLKPQHRQSRFVQLEFQIPGTSEIVWARGEVRRDELELPPWRRDSELVHGSGLRL